MPPVLLDLDSHTCCYKILSMIISYAICHTEKYKQSLFLWFSIFEFFQEFSFCGLLKQTEQTRTEVESARLWTTKGIMQELDGGGVHQ